MTHAPGVARVARATGATGEPSIEYSLTLEGGLANVTVTVTNSIQSTVINLKLLALNVQDHHLTEDSLSSLRFQQTRTTSERKLTQSSNLDLIVRTHCSLGFFKPLQHEAKAVSHTSLILPRLTQRCDSFVPRTVWNLLWQTVKNY